MSAGPVPPDRTGDGGDYADTFSPGPDNRTARKSRLRVLQFLPSVESASGGPVRSTLANCRAAHRADPALETTWISTRHGLEPGWEHELRASLPPGMTLRLFPQVGRHTANVSAELLRWLWQQADEFDLLVLRALMHPLSSAVGWVARRKTLPYLVVPHGTLSEWTFRHRRRLLKRVYFRLVERRTLDGAAVIRFTSEAERDEARRLNFSPEAAVIPHPFEPRDDFEEPADRQKGLVLFLSRLDPKKGIDIVLPAIALAREQRSDLRLVLAGSGAPSYERKVRKLIAEFGLEGTVEMPGFVSGRDKDDLLRSAAVFVLPSEEENFGIAAVEALDAGVPVVISPEVDVAPAVEEYRAGQVVERSADAVAEAMLGILSDRDEARAMGERGRRLVRERFAPGLVGPEVAELYRQCSRRKA